jgi:crotonobetainyl-CoA:carnitine CoA-transferase CaiB-like acyl-CoA transferase
LGTGGCPIIWNCKDGDIAVFIQTGSQGKKTQQIVEWMASEGMAGDLTEVSWTEVSARNMPKDVLDHWTEIFQRFFLTKTKQEIDGKANTDKLQMFIAKSPEDFLTDPQLKARGFWVAMDIPDVDEKILFPNFPVVSDKLTRKITRAPLIGEHNQTIYRKELGLSVEEVTQLQDRYVI